jgi:hypothetical protein
MSWTGQAKLRRQTIGALPNKQGKGNPQTFDVPNIGYLSDIEISTILTSQLGVAAASAADPFAQYSGGMDRVTLYVNSIGNLIDVSGEMLAVITAIDDNYRYGNSTVMGTPANFVSAATAGTNSTTNEWHHRIPLSLELRNLPWPIGLFQTALQNLSVRTQIRQLPLLATSGAPGTGLYVPAGTTTVVSDEQGQNQLLEKYFDPIGDPASQPYLGFLHRWTQWQVPLTKSGDLQILLPGQNYYLRMVFWIVSGASGALAPDSTHLQRLRLMYGANLAAFDEDETKKEVSARMRRQYGSMFSSLPAGVYTLDIVHETHDNRDWINAAGTTNLRAVLTMDPAGTYTGGGYVNIAVEEVAPLLLPAGAVVQGSAPMVTAGQ